MSTGMVAASFAQQVYHMYIALGLISGKCAAEQGRRGSDPTCLSFSLSLLSLKSVGSQISGFEVG